MCVCVCQCVCQCVFVTNLLCNLADPGRSTVGKVRSSGAPAHWRLHALIGGYTCREGHGESDFFIDFWDLMPFSAVFFPPLIFSLNAKRPIRIKRVEASALTVLLAISGLNELQKGVKLKADLRVSSGESQLLAPVLPYSVFNESNFAAYIYLHNQHESFCSNGALSCRQLRGDRKSLPI